MRRVHRVELEGKMTQVLRVEDLRQPIHIALGNLEAATQEELDDIVADLNHELQRREPEDTRTP